MGVVLLFHGLNLAPRAMDPLAQELQKLGFDTVQTTFRGHDGNHEAFRSVTRQEWLFDVEGAFERAVQIADRKQVPLYVIGFSMGGLLAIDYLQDHPELRDRVRKMVLLAPALSLHSVARLLAVSRYLPKNWMIPSLAPQEYAANKGTSIAAYRALYESSRKVRSIGLEAFSRIPTQVWAHPKDELVSALGLEEMAHGMKEWMYFPVDQDATIRLSRRFYHFIVHPDAVGDRSYAHLLNEIEAHLLSR